MNVLYYKIPKNKHLDSLNKQSRDMLKNVIKEEWLKKPANELLDKLHRDVRVVNGIVGDDDWYLKWCYEPFEQMCKLLEIEVIQEYLRGKK